MHYDKIYEYNLYQIDSTQLSKNYGDLIRKNNGTFQDKHYLYLNTLYNLNVIRKTTEPFIYINKNLNKIQTDKPLCVINPNSNYLGFDSRFWGTNNYQTVINALKDKINFIAVGSNNYNCFIHAKPLNNLYLDLVNKTSIEETLNIIEQADFVLTHESGLYHAGCIPGNKIRHVIVPAGSRMTLCTNYWQTKNVIVHWLDNKNKELYYKHCFHENEHSCHNGCIFSEMNFSTFLHKEYGTNCKLPVFNNGEVLSHCLYNIKPETVIELIENILENKDDKNN